MITLSCVLLFISLNSLADDPCSKAINKEDSRRDPTMHNTDGRQEMCDSYLSPDFWYFFGGEISRSCLDYNRCSTYATAWYDGEYPKGDEIVVGRACAKWERYDCCSWTGEMKVKNCSFGMIYQLAIPDFCSISYCVGTATPCRWYNVFHEGNCYPVPRLRDPILSHPYISGYKQFDGFNATIFSIDCSYSRWSDLNITANGTLKIRVLFKMDKEVIAKFMVDGDIRKVTLEESYLVGHIGKKLICEHQPYREFPDGSISSGGDIRFDKGLYLGINFTDSEGRPIEKITIGQSEIKEVYLNATFPITFGHCLNQSECKVQKYPLDVKSTKQRVLLNDCKFHLENAEGELIFTSKRPLKIAAAVTPGKEMSTDELKFALVKHPEVTTIFDGYVFPSLKVEVLETQKQPLCYSEGDPHIVTFSGLAIDNYETGDFNMLSSTNRNFQIQVRQIPCWEERITCNCGIFVKEGNNLVGITSCDYKTAPLVVDLMRDNVNPIGIIRKINDDYEIKLVSGISIKINFIFETKRNSTFMNIFVSSLKTEMYDGFCAATITSTNFSIFRIPYSQSFFKDDLPPCANELLNFPICTCTSENGELVTCNYEKTDTNVKFIKLENVCDVRGHRERKRRSVDRDRVELISSSGGLSAGYENDKILHEVIRINDQITPSASKRVSLNESRRLCYSIFERFKYEKECHEILGHKQMEMQKNCIDDVQLSGSVEISRFYLSIYEEVCLSLLEREVVIVDGQTSVDNSSLLKIIKAMRAESAERVQNVKVTTEWDKYPERRTRDQAWLENVEPFHFVGIIAAFAIVGVALAGFCCHRSLKNKRLPTKRKKLNIAKPGLDLRGERLERPARLLQNQKMTAETTMPTSRNNQARLCRLSTLVGCNLLPICLHICI